MLQVRNGDVNLKVLGDTELVEMPFTKGLTSERVVEVNGTDDVEVDDVLIVAVR